MSYLEDRFAQLESKQQEAKAAAIERARLRALLEVQQEYRAYTRILLNELAVSCIEKSVVQAALYAFNIADNNLAKALSEFQ